MFQRLVSLWQRWNRTPRTSQASGTGVPAAERRLWERYSSELETTLETVSPPGEARLRARIRDISAGGIQVAVNHCYETGTLLNVHLPRSTANACLSMLASVVHVSSPADGTWALGCSFIRELNDAELQSLL